MKDMKEEVEKVIEQIRPNLQADGGDIEIVDIDEEDGIVRVRLMGACGFCPMSTMTLQMGVERVIKEQVPGVKRVEAV